MEDSPHLHETPRRVLDPQVIADRDMRRIAVKKNDEAAVPLSDRSRGERIRDVLSAIKNFLMVEGAAEARAEREKQEGSQVVDFRRG